MRPMKLPSEEEEEHRVSPHHGENVEQESPNLLFEWSVKKTKFDSIHRDMK